MYCVLEWCLLLSLCEWHRLGWQIFKDKNHLNFFTCNECWRDDLVDRWLSQRHWVDFQFVYHFCPSQLSGKPPIELSSLWGLGYRAIPLSRYLATPLSRYPTIPLSHYLAAPLSRYPAISLPHCPATLLSRYPVVPLSRCPTVPLSHCPAVPLPTVCVHPRAP